MLDVSDKQRRQFTTDETRNDLLGLSHRGRAYPLPPPPPSLNTSQVQSMEELTPQGVRNKFADLTADGLFCPEDLLRRLASQLPASTLAEFMDDLDHGRV